MSTLRIRGFWLLTAVILLAASAALAQEPVVVLSIKSTDALINDLKYMLSTAGTEGELIDGLIDQMTQGKGLSGIDRSKPLGAYMTLDAAGTPSYVMFVPVNDNLAFRDLLGTAFPRQRDGAGGTFSLEGDDQQFYGRFANGHCFLTVQPHALDRLPDPSKIAIRKYSFGVEANLAKIPSEVKDGLIEKFAARLAEAAQDEESPVSALEARIRTRTRKITVELTRMLIKEGDRLALGLDVDHQGKRVALDVNLVAKSGTPLAGSIASYARTASSFASLGGSDAAVSLTCAMPVSSEMRELFREAIRSGMEQAREDIDQSELQTEEQKKLMKDLLDRVTEVVEATGEAGNVDTALVVNTAADGKAQIVGAARIAQGDELARAVDELAKQRTEQSGGDKVQLDVANHGGTRIHAIELNLSHDARQSISAGLAHIAIRNDAVYFAIGGDSLAAVKTAIDKTGKGGSTRPPISLRAQPSQLVALFGTRDDPNIELAREAFAGTGDYFSLDILPVDRGARLRMEFGEGFLRLIALGMSQQLDE